MMHAWAKHPKTIRLVSGFFIVILFAWGGGWKLAQPWIAHLDQKIYDLRLAQTPSLQDARIVIVDVDEKSLAEQGRWPWPRDDIAALIDQLATAKVIAFDVVFADRDKPGCCPTPLDILFWPPVLKSPIGPASVRISLTSGEPQKRKGSLTRYPIVTVSCAPYPCSPSTRGNCTNPWP